jgi:lipopolysaccharide transport system permease protein
MFVKRDFVSSFKQTILGPLWFFINPIFTTVVYLIVFGNIANLSTDGALNSFLSSRSNALELFF